MVTAATIKGIKFRLLAKDLNCTNSLPSLWIQTPYLSCLSSSRVRFPPLTQPYIAAIVSAPPPASKAAPFQPGQTRLPSSFPPPQVTGITDSCTAPSLSISLSPKSTSTTSPLRRYPLTFSPKQTGYATINLSRSINSLTTARSRLSNVNTPIVRIHNQPSHKEGPSTTVEIAKAPPHPS